jgi:xanthine dehydrogenase YagR molybdenum-binding subunit
LEDITVRDAGIQVTDDPARFETYADILARHGLDEITVESESASPGETSSATMMASGGRFFPFTAPSTGARAHAGSFAAHFVEVHVDPDLGTIRVARVVSAVDGGRIVNPKTARSQIIGGIAGGIGMALLEESVSDGTGRLVNTLLADYVVAVNADVRECAVGGTARFDESSQNKGCRRTCPHRGGSRHRQCRLSCDRREGPLAADLH